MKPKSKIKKSAIISPKKVAKYAKQKPNIKSAVPMTKIGLKRTISGRPVVAAKSNKNIRYSEKDLIEFRKIIVEKLTLAKTDRELLRTSLGRTDDHGTEDTSPTFKIMEDGSDVETKEETTQLALRQERFIQNLENALIRIENKTYGVCRVTGKLIPKQRLLSVPHATLSIDAKLEQQFNQSGSMAAAY